MALIEWREEYCTGITGVDHEHQQLIEQINSVYDLLGEHDDKQLVVDSLGEIYGNISVHFALEEQTMSRLDYDHYEQHKADHERLLDEIREITEEYEKTIILDESVFQQKLADWFQLHFKTHDARLHHLAGLPLHEQADESLVKALIQKAKIGFLRGDRQ